MGDERRDKENQEELVRKIAAGDPAALEKCRIKFLEIARVTVNRVLSYKDDEDFAMEALVIIYYVIKNGRFNAINVYGYGQRIILYQFLKDLKKQRKYEDMLKEMNGQQFSHKEYMEFEEIEQEIGMSSGHTLPFADSSMDVYGTIWQKKEEDVEDDFKSMEEAMAVSKDEECIQLITLKYFDNLSHNEISHLLGKPEVNCRAKLSRCIKKLRKEIAKREKKSFKKKST